MNAATIIKAGFPEATESEVEHVLWGRTPFPFGLSPKGLFKAASGFRRACANGKTLCDHCHNEAISGRWMCAKCDAALRPIQTPD